MAGRKNEVFNLLFPKSFLLVEEWDAAPCHTLLCLTQHSRMLPVRAHRKLLFHLLSYRLPSAFTDLVGPWELDHAEETQLKQNDSRKAPVPLWCGCTSASSKTVASERAADALHHSQHLFFTGKPMLLPVWASGCTSAPMEYRDRFVMSSAAEELEGHSIWAASPYSSANLFIKMLALQWTSAPLQ